MSEGNTWVGSRLRTNLDGIGNCDRSENMSIDKRHRIMCEIRQHCPIQTDLKQESSSSMPAVEKLLA